MIESRARTETCDCRIDSVNVRGGRDGANTIALGLSTEREKICNIPCGELGRRMISDGFIHSR